MTEKNNSKTVRAGTTTYFFDLKVTKDGKPYLVITESRYLGDEKERKRTSMAVFQEHGKAFADAVSEMTAKLG